MKYDQYDKLGYFWVSLGGKVAMQQLEQVYTLQFLRQFLGVPTTTSTKFVYAEFGKLPLKHSWLQSSFTYLACNRWMKIGCARWHSKLICMVLGSQG